jgi:hypothetical protein
MQLYGKQYSVEDLRRRVGNMDQVAGIRLAQRDDGNERPTRAAQFHTGSGLEFTVLPDRGMDIASASFQGKALGWRSPTGDVAPHYYEAEGIRWLRSYFGGLMTTCGLMNVGSPAADSASSGNGLHGRISHIPARNLKLTQEWQNDEYVLSLSGTMRETALFAENLTLTRTVSTRLGAKCLRVHDVLANEGFRPAQYMLLYHCNIGWPIVDAGSRILTPSRLIAPRDAIAREGAAQWNRLDPPTHGYAEKVYYHDMAAARDGAVTVGIVNDGFRRGEGLGVYLKYNKKELPRFVQWKMMGEQEYVAGLEPCTCGVEGRAVDESLGLLHTLQPGESKHITLEFGAISTREELRALEDLCGDAKAKLVENYQPFVKKP